MSTSATPGRLTCATAGRHIPGCFNPTFPTRTVGTTVTACICGERWWPGHVGTWHIKWAKEKTGERVAGGAIYGDVPVGHYFLHTDECPNPTTHPDFNHLCADVPESSAADTWRAT